MPAEESLQKLFSSFPEGWPGIGLVLLRVTVAFEAVVQVIGTLAGTHVTTLEWMMAMSAILVILAILVGFLTPFAGAFASLANIAIGISCLTSGATNSQDRAFLAFSQFVMSLTLILLGPGAFSIDAYLFGRREIIIPESPRTPEL